MEGFISESIHATPDAARAAEAYAEIIAIHLDRELAPHDDPAAARTSRELNDLWHAVHADLGHPWNVEELARRAHVSQVQFHRIVARFHNTTPMGMVTRLRMQRAEQLLLSTDYPLKLVADLVGYETPFAFSRAFKRHAGKSPKFYRTAARHS
jgi:transcriptional regulator GlxA family with amidase domain